MKTTTVKQKKKPETLRQAKTMTAAEWLKSIERTRVPRPDRDFGEMLRLERLSE